jgi:hypothetical protein
MCSEVVARWVMQTIASTRWQTAMVRYHSMLKDNTDCDTDLLFCPACIIVQLLNLNREQVQCPGAAGVRVRACPVLRSGCAVVRLG